LSTEAAPHVEEGFLLAGEGGFGQVFSGRRGAHCHRDAVAGVHGGPALEHGALEVGVEGRIHDPLADARAAARQRLDVLDVERGKLGSDALVETILVQELAVGVGSGGEALRHAHAEAGEGAQHFAYRGILAADALDILHADFVEGQYVFHHRCVLRLRPGKSYCPRNGRVGHCLSGPNV